MTDSTATYQRLFAELKRRNVFRVMAVYGIVGFVVLQVVDLLIPALLLPEWTYRLVAVLLLAGFPVAVVLAWAFEQTPAGLKRTAPADPGEIHAIVTEPAHRRWPAGLLALLGLALLLGGWWMGRRDAPVTAAADAAASPALRLAMAEEQRDSLPAIAVLPFLDLSPGGDQEYFSDGMSEELLNTLVKVRGLRVVGRTSSFAFKGKNEDLREIGDALGARYIVEGSVRKDGDRLRITAQLIDADQNVHLWSNTYDREMNDVFAIQSEIAGAIAGELRIPLGLDGEPLISPTADFEAYDLYLAGRSRMRERGGSLQEAVTMFEAAIARDSAWAPAWAGLAESQALLPYYTPESDSAVWASSLASAERAAERALSLDPRNASALVALGNVRRDRREWEAAEDAYVRALTVDPENVEALQQFAEYFSYIGRMDEGYRLARRALALDPAPIRLNIAAMMASYNGRYDEAIELYEEGIRADPEGRVPALRGNRGSPAVATGDLHGHRRRRARSASVGALSRTSVAAGSIPSLAVSDFPRSPARLPAVRSRARRERRRGNAARAASPRGRRHRQGICFVVVRALVRACTSRGSVPLRESRPRSPTPSTSAGRRTRVACC